MKRQLKKQIHEKNQLLHELDRTRIDLETAYANFQNVLDPDLIDSCIYEVNACQKRYKFLLDKAKQLDTY